MAKKKVYLYSVQYDRNGKHYVLFLRTLSACVAWLKVLCDVPYSGFRAYRHQFDDNDILRFREIDEITEQVLSVVDKLFPLKHMNNE